MVIIRIEASASCSAANLPSIPPRSGEALYTQFMTDHPKVMSLINAFESLAPTRFAEPWDNVGLLLGSPDEHLHGPVLLCIDLTHAVLDEAKAVGSSCLVCYHPPLFSAIKRLTTTDARQGLVLRAAREGVSLYSPHTALDAAPDGMADWLASCCLPPGQTMHADRRALQPSAIQEETQQLKVVTFVPTSEAHRVRDALATAGSGRIGNYEVCSFSSEGTGTFLGNAGTHPATGNAGRLETNTEVRLEMVCSRRSLALAMATLRQFHPYAEPAIDVYPLHPQPQRDTGAGRRLVLDRPATLSEIAKRLKAALGVPHIEVAAATEQPINCIGVCPGSGGELMAPAIAEGCELLVTGEMKHHDVLAAVNQGLSIMLAGHTRTERPYLPILAQRLAAKLAGVGVSILVSKADADVLRAE